MAELFRDPELESLINQMNAGDEAAAQPAPPAAPGLDAPGLLQVGPGEPLEALLAATVRRGASDLVLVPGSPPVLRVAALVRAGAITHAEACRLANRPEELERRV